jgi:hypothetical protein
MTTDSWRVRVSVRDVGPATPSRGGGVSYEPLCWY